MSSTHTIEVRTRQVGPWPMNSYALVCREIGESILIDPGADPDTLSEMLAGTTPVAILLTHTHPDHVGALDTMRSRLHVPLMAHPGPHFQGMDLKAERELVGGDNINFGAIKLHVYHTPGHIDDQICLLVEGAPIAIVGDTLFDGGPGKTWSPDGFNITLATLRGVVLHWPDETVCYPGHGPSFRLGDRRAAIEAFLARVYPEHFFGDATWE